MKRYALLAVTALVLLASAAAWAAPVVTNVTASQDATSLVVTIHYDLAEPENGDWPYVDVDISLNGGITWAFTTDYTINGLSQYTPLPHVTGDTRIHISPGTGKTISWDSVMDASNVHITNCKVRINASTCKGYAGPMVTVPAGQFQMGYREGDLCPNDDARPIHYVTLAAYDIAKLEVTRGEYKKFIDDGGYSNSAYWSTRGLAWKNSVGRTQPDYWATVQNWGTPPGEFSQTMRHPVVGVTWFEAQAYCRWLNARYTQPGDPQWHLPTEAQWERAARGTDVRTYPWGNDWDSMKLKCINVNDPRFPGSQTAPVGSYNPLNPATDGSSPCGCLDMAGNVCEWVNDFYGASFYSSGQNTNPQGQQNSSHKITRGGSWNYSVQSCDFPVYHRNPDGVDASRPDYGFRIARGGIWGVADVDL